MLTHEEYKDLFQLLPIGLYRTSLKDGTFLEANIVCANLLGYNSVESLKENAKAGDFYYSKDDRKKFINAVKENGIIYNYELRLKEIWVAITARINEEAGWLEGTLMCITRRKNSEEEVRRYRALEFDKLQLIKEAARQRCVEHDNGKSDMECHSELQPVGLPQ